MMHSRFLFALFLLSLASPLAAGTLSDDSARVSLIWGYKQAGDSAQVERLLAADGLPASPEWEKLANFLSAYFAFADSDVALVPTLLDLGVPDELDEHAEWLRAAAFEQLGQPGLAGIYWRKLLESPLQEYKDLAAEHLFDDALSQGNPDTLHGLSKAARESRVGSGIRQEIDLELSGLLSLSGQHPEASGLLRRIYLLSPGTSSGKAAKKKLDEYAVTFGYSVPDPGWSGEWEEIERLESAGLKSSALDKLAGLRKRGRYAAHDEQMMAMQARMSAALRRHDDALKFAKQHVKQFPNSAYRDEMLVVIVRSAFLSDQDDFAIETARELQHTGKDASQIGEAWRLISLLYIDQDSLALAASAASNWYRALGGAKGADDALWMRGWTRFLAGQYSESASDFVTLVKSYPQSGYVPVGLYWAARSSEQAGDNERRDSLCTVLRSKFPFSYYARLACPDGIQPAPIPLDMRTLNLDELFASCGPRTRGFAELIALGLWDLALREWPEVENECGKRADIAWWRPLLYWKAGERFESWKWIIREYRDEAASVGSRPDEFPELWYPLDYEPLLLQDCAEYGVDPYLALGVICQESHFDDQVVSPSGAVGLMQLMPATAREQVRKMGQSVRESDLLHGPRNLEIGIAHIADLQRELNGDTILTLCAYNAGINAAKRWKSEFGHYPPDVFVELIPYRETRLYVKHIMQHMSAYRRLYPDLKLPSPDSEN
ncbi:MAG: lytic transglycosylase domain-containing protein [Calditrichaeota bacterium]|nr:lytic transglycosylase domain-containing protein [Calditrichota bacterium]MCB9366840.1 lytic transglycosylase domain-containing protein [Calditrichota bacterium]